MPASKHRITNFDLAHGHVIAEKYVVEQKLGSGWEGEVYKIVEAGTGIERAAKLFFPYRNPRNSTARRYALKLHKLRHCGILIQYLTQDFVELFGQRISMLISEYVEGELLSALLRRQPGRALPPFEALHLLNALASGIAEIHMAREYHGDLHTDNIILRRYGLGYEVKVIDLFHWDAPKRENIKQDVCDLIRIFYDALGGARRYRKHPEEVKAVCCGLKRSLILKKFRTAGQIRDYLETIEWR
jgi:tRNA A-37 threonylcarbamoyl transferase component Bud32